MSFACEGLERRTFQRVLIGRSKALRVETSLEFLRKREQVCMTGTEQIWDEVGIRHIEGQMVKGLVDHMGVCVLFYT